MLRVNKTLQMMNTIKYCFLNKDKILTIWSLLIMIFLNMKLISRKIIVLKNLNKVI